MANALNTVVEADAESCRLTARWLHQLHTGTHDLGTGLHRAESESESVWEGEAGDAFRTLISGNAGDADQTAEFLNRTRIALETFADSITTVTSRINQARTVAQEGGLVVTPTTIEEPPKPDIPLYSPAPGARSENRERSPEDQRILAEYQALVDVWTEVKVTVDDARSTERKAHDALIAGLKMMKDFTSYLVPQGWAWGPVATGSYSGPYVTARDLTSAAATAQAKADGALAVLMDPTLTPADRQKVLSNQELWSGKVDAARTSAQSVKNIDARVPGAPAFKGFVGWSARGVGAAGAVVTAYQTYDAIQKGVAPDKAITKGVATTAGGTAVGLGMYALAGAGYISGAVATGGTLVIGTAVAAGIGYLVDQHYYD
ncbi:hypothetical protein REH65_14830 [Saccharopolyspora sp. ID03-671]|uniref:putative T7SS-secreted protein n=1 Tax=Saccharopolyspora sp. ID03-671 TaxID=3073066 RepID=UPI003254C2EF